MNAWNNFNGGDWETGINVRDFIQKNYTPYDGDSAFLAPATARTTALREKFDALLAEEREKGGVRNIDTETVITITAFGPGYLDKDSEIIVGLQTDEPLKRACNPFGGMRMVRDACKQYGYEVSPKIEEEFKYHKTHNDGVFSAYTKDVREARHVGLLTGLPSYTFDCSPRMVTTPCALLTTTVIVESAGFSPSAPSSQAWPLASYAAVRVWVPSVRDFR